MVKEFMHNFKGGFKEGLDSIETIQLVTKQPFRLKAARFEE